MKVPHFLWENKLLAGWAFALRSQDVKERLPSCLVVFFRLAVVASDSLGAIAQFASLLMLILTTCLRKNMRIFQFIPEDLCIHSRHLHQRQEANYEKEKASL